MVRWCVGCVKGWIGAVIGLAALLALSEMGLRIAAVVKPVHSASNTFAQTVPLAVPSWTTGWQLRPSSRLTIRPEHGAPFVFRTNSWGLRGGDLAVPKPPGTFRIVCVGDAALLGRDCPEPATFCTQLQQQLSTGTNYSIEVVNAALPLGGPALSAIHAQRTVSLLQPDVVIVQLDAADLAEDAALRRWLVCDPQGRPVGCAPPDMPPSSAKTGIAQWRTEFRLLDLAICTLANKWGEANAAPVSKPTHEPSAEDVARILAPLMDAQKRCEAAYCRLIVMATPNRGSIWTATITTTSINDAKFLAAAGPFIVAHNLTGIDATSAFQKDVQENGRWTIAEHRRAAEFVARQLRERVPGPWSSPYFQQPPIHPVSYPQATTLQQGAGP